MKLLLFSILTCYFLVETSGLPNWLDIVKYELLKKCPWLTWDKGNANRDELKRCLMTFDIDDLKKMVQEANEASARIKWINGVNGLDGINELNG